MWVNLCNRKRGEWAMIKPNEVLKGIEELYSQLHTDHWDGERITEEQTRHEGLVLKQIIQELELILEETVDESIDDFVDECREELHNVARDIDALVKKEFNKTDIFCIFDGLETKWNSIDKWGYDSHMINRIKKTSNMIKDYYWEVGAPNREAKWKQRQREKDEALMRPRISKELRDLWDSVG